MDLVFRYNPEVEDVEIVSIINEQETVLDTVGSDVVESWIKNYNEKHDYVQRTEEDVQAEEDARNQLQAEVDALKTQVEELNTALEAEKNKAETE